jgi:hypothetical protein
MPLHCGSCTEAWHMPCALALAAALRLAQSLGKRLRLVLVAHGLWSVIDDTTPSTV